MRRLIKLIIASTIGFISLGNISISAQSIELDVGHVVASDHAYHLGLVRFAELLDEKTDGDIKVNIYPGGQLGSERSLVESLSMGALDMVLSNSGNLATFTNAYQIYDFPFLFEDREHAHEVLDSEIGQESLNRLSELGIKGLANWESGFFSTWNNARPIHTPEDMVGLKIRANDNPIHIDSYDVLGVSAITMGWGEVYSSIQNGTVDGVAVAIPSMFTSRIQEVTPYLSTSGEFYVTAVLMINEDLFNSLSEEYQQIIIETAQEVTQYQRDLNGQQEQEMIEALEAEGFEVTHPDRAQFKEVVFEEIVSKYQDSVDIDAVRQIENMRK